MSVLSFVNEELVGWSQQGGKQMMVTLMTSLPFPNLRLYFSCGNLGLNRLSTEIITLLMIFVIMAFLMVTCGLLVGSC